MESIHDKNTIKTFTMKTSLKNHFDKINQIHTESRPQCNSYWHQLKESTGILSNTL